LSYLKVIPNGLVINIVSFVVVFLLGTVRYLHTNSSGAVGGFDDNVFIQLQSDWKCQCRCFLLWQINGAAAIRI